MNFSARNSIFFLLLAGLIACAGFIIAEGGILALGALIGLPLGVIYIGSILKWPVVALYSSLVISFFSSGIVRYIDAPLSLSVDVLLILGILLEFIRRTNTQSWPNIRKNPILISILLWTLFCILEIFNPEAHSFTAWFYAVRGVALYLLFSVFLGLIELESEAHLRHFLNIWIVLSILGVVYGAKQLFLGVDSYEQAWLDSGQALTHVLFGRLRVFSFYSDAGQFGAAMGHTAITALIIAMGPLSRKSRIWYGLAALICFWGMAISGTRGALFVPVVGAFMYLVLTKNIKIIIAGGVIVGALLFILKFTFIGQSNYQIQRLRSALDPTDASFQVRLANQKKLSDYLASRPFGGGIGTIGYWGLRFSPNTFLAQTPPDSWYVKIWAETGVIGLVFHIIMILYWHVFFFRRIWVMPPGEMRQKMMGLYAGMAGISFASYGNQLLGQLPTANIIYLSLVFMYFFTKESYGTANELFPENHFGHGRRAHDSANSPVMFK